MSMRGTGDKICVTLLCYSGLGLTFGLLVVAVAGWLAADKISFFTELKLLDTEVSEQFSDISVVDHGAYILIAIGVAIVLQGILGCAGTLMGCCRSKNARSCLIGYGVAVALVIICEIVAAVLVLEVFQDEVKDKAKVFMEETIRQDYKIPSAGEGPANSVTVLWDRIMTSLHCCGVSNYLDFPDTIPPACCLSRDNFTAPVTCPDPTSGQELPSQMTQGCLPILTTVSIPAIASSLAVVALFQLCGVLLSCFLSRRVEESREWYEMSSMSR